MTEISPTKPAISNDGIPLQNCPCCKGLSGLIYGVPSSKIVDPKWRVCPKCDGYGQLDWIEMIMGKRKE